MSKRRVLGSVDDAIAFFAAYSVMFYCFFADHEHVFGKSPYILHIYIYIQYDVVFFAYHGHCLLFMERFVCNLHAYSAYLQYMEDTGRSKMRQTFWSFRGFRTK